MSPTEPEKPLPTGRDASGWAILLSGLALWTAVQSFMICPPLWNRSLLPEVDDSLAFLVRTQEMEECFFQDCPALQDLRMQRTVDSSDPRVMRAHDLSAFPFPFYHPLFSLLLLAVKGFGGDLATSYRLLWSLSPFYFGAAFACLLTVLWGKRAGGVALGLLAFKVFPDTGLHYFTPANFALGLAVLLWARVIQRRGDAPWTLLVGSLLLVLIHPIGGIHAMMAVALAVTMPREGSRRRLWYSILALFLFSLLAAALASKVTEPAILNVFGHMDHLPDITQIVSAYVSNLGGVVVGISRLQESLFGKFAFFLPAAATGFFLATTEQRKVLTRVILVYGLILLVSLYHTHVISPTGDLFFRLWIPFVVILFGAVGKALEEFSRTTWNLARTYRTLNPETTQTILGQAWPILMFALLLGYSADMALTGGEHLYATSEYMRNRQALHFDPGQVDHLLTKAGPQDRVLYTGVMPMAFYFAKGAMRLGAVYYHPAYSETPIATDWLTRQDLRFAVAYHPAVYHPSLEGLDEKDQCISSPEYRFSPLSKPRRYGHILKEGFIPGEDFQWMEITPMAPDHPRRLKILVSNPGGARQLEIVALGTDGRQLPDQTGRLSIPPQWTGWLHHDLRDNPPGTALRVHLPQGPNRLAIGGIVFGDTHLQWPWEQKAKLTILARDPHTGRVTLSFDPEALLPTLPTGCRITVMDDRGSTVLLGIDR